ncbi:glycosyltransferase [Chloroflexota bacterium]
MRICLLGNAESIHLQRFAAWFAERGHEVHVLTFVDGEIEKVGVHHVKLRIMPLPYPYEYLISLPFQIRQVREMVKEIKPDILHGHFLSNYGLYAACTGFHPLVVSAWGSDMLIVPKRDLLVKALTKYTLKKADCVACFSSAIKEEAVKLGAASDKLEVAFVGISIEEFNSGQRDETLCQELGIADLPVVISTRSLAYIYDVESLVRSIPLILQEVPETKFIIAGDGKQKYYLESLSSKLGISDSIRFVGQVPHDELPRYLASADIYVSTSLSDGTSQSLLEAMACELAPVVTDIPANQPWINNGENGFLFPVKSIQALADSVVYLLQNKDIREKFGKVSREVIEERAEYGREMERMEKIYHKLLRA